MPIFPLPPRLEAMVPYVIPGHAMADIGTDHARLPCALVGRGIVPNALACDRNPRPLKVAQRTIRAAGIEHDIELRLGDGMSTLSNGEVATVVIAGMGGRSIARMIESAGEIGSIRLILQAQTDIEYLRRSIVGLGLILGDEYLVQDRGRFYPTLIASVPSLVRDDKEGRGNDRGYDQRYAWRYPRSGVPNSSEWTRLDWKWGPVLRRSGDPLYRPWLLYCRGGIEARRWHPQHQRSLSSALKQEWDLQIAELSAELDRIAKGADPEPGNWANSVFEAGNSPVRPTFT